MTAPPTSTPREYRFGSRSITTATAVLLCWLPLALPGQPPTTLTPQFQQPAPKENPDAVQATIDRAIEDLLDGSVEHQVGAAMILGKYAHPRARRALRDALDHDEVRVRRAALISVLEQRSGRLSRELVERMLLMLGDPDVEIRRQISSVLGQLSAALRIASTRGPRPPGSRANSLPEGFPEVLHRAFRDDDVVVRRNMLTNYHAFPLGGARRSILVASLADDDRQVRLQALRLAGQYVPTDAFLEAALEHPLGNDSAWDRELARQLGRHRHPDSRETLRRLRDSEDRTTAIEAEVSTFQLDPNLDSPIFDRLRTERVPEDPAQRAVRLLYRLDQEVAWEITRSLLDAESAVVRTEAVTLWLNLSPEFPEKDNILRLLDDRSSHVRERVLGFLHAHANRTPPGIVRDLARHDRREVRESVFRHLRHQPEEVVREVLFDLLIDDDLPLRRRALEQVAAQQLDDWKRVVRASLRDPHQEFQIQAARILLEKGDERDLKLLRERRAADPESPLAAFLDKHLPDGEAVEPRASERL